MVVAAPVNIVYNPCTQFESFPRFEWRGRIHDGVMPGELVSATASP
jgi:hypothetical protein